MSPPCPSITEFGWEVNKGQVNIRWMTKAAAPDEILENCGCKSGCSTRRCPCQKAELKCTGLCSCCTNSPDQNTLIQTRTICQMMTMMMAYYSNLMSMPLDSMAYLKNNDDNARRCYLRSAVDQLYLFTYSIFS